MEAPQKDKNRRSRPTTSTAPELGRNERREEDDGGATASRTAPARVTKASSDSETLHQTGGEVPNQTTTWKASRKETTNPTTTWKASHEGMKNMPKIRNGPGGGWKTLGQGGQSTAPSGET